MFKRLNNFFFKIFSKFMKECMFINVHRKNRNAYAQLMLHMLKRGVLEGPFTSKPQEGPLPTLPPYMVLIYMMISCIKIYVVIFNK